jgi:multidrug transporter EmrE-like cation transporter
MEYILGIVSIEAFGDYQLARYADQAKWWQLGLGYGSYAILLSLFIKAIQEKGLGWANAAWDGWSNLATGAVAIFILKEKPTLRELAGMMLVSAGILLLGNRGTARY